MSFQVYLTTAEEVIGAVDATVQKREGATDQLISDFLDIPLQNARNAAKMAVQLGFITENAKNTFKPIYPYATYLITSNAKQRAAILRFLLEEYDPYKTFKNRLIITSSVQDSANQVKALYQIDAHRGDIASTLISLGTFTNSISAEGAGKFTPVISKVNNFLFEFEEVINDKQTVELKIRQRMGEEICQWISFEDVLSPLVTAYQRTFHVNEDPRAPIVHAGNAFESFLVQVADHYTVNIERASGINAKIDAITNAGHLTVKHKNVSKYLGHIRNACDHGVDATIGQAWTITPETAVEYVHVCLTSIRSIYDCIHGNYII